MKEDRLSNFELLRIFSIFLILIHHFIVHGVTNGSMTNAFLLVDSFAIIGVDVFLLISGYFRIKLTIKSFLNLCFICMFYKVVHLCVDTFVFGIDHSLYEWFLKPLFVVSHSGGWFVQVYFMLMFVSPLLNKAMENLSSKEWKLSFGLLTIITIYLGWILHTYEDSYGYTLMTFVYLYYIGSCIKQFDLIRKINKWWLMLIIIIGVCVTFVGRCFLENPHLQIHFEAYNSPAIIITACAVFSYFGKIQVRNKIINIIALSVLPVYLLTDGGNISIKLYSYIRTISRVNEFWLQFLLFMFLAIVIILIITCFDQIRRTIYMFLSKIIKLKNHNV